MARSRRAKLGNPNGAAAIRRAGKGGAPLRAAIARNADRHAQELAPVVDGHSLRRRDEPAGDRGRAERAWHADPARRALARLDVQNLLDRLELREAEWGKTRLMSLVEAVTNVAVGSWRAVMTQLLVFPTFGLVTTLGQNLAIGSIFTTVSLARSYGLRRAFEALAMPSAGIMTLVAQQPRRSRGERRLGGGRSRGVRLGNPNGAAALRRAGKGGAPLRAAIARNADRHAQDLAPVVEDIRSGGATSLRAIADELNARGMLTRRGGRWHVSTVMNLLDRLGVREAACASPG